VEKSFSTATPGYVNHPDSSPRLAPVCGFYFMDYFRVGHNPAKPLLSSPSCTALVAQLEDGVRTTRSCSASNGSGNTRAIGAYPRVLGQMSATCWHLLLSMVGRTHDLMRPRIRIQSNKGEVLPRHIPVLGPSNYHLCRKNYLSTNRCQRGHRRS